MRALAPEAARPGAGRAAEHAPVAVGASGDVLARAGARRLAQQPADAHHAVGLHLAVGAFGIGGAAHRASVLGALRGGAPTPLEPFFSNIRSVCIGNAARRRRTGLETSRMSRWGAGAECCYVENG